MIIDLNRLVLLVVATIFGFFVSMFEKPKRNGTRRLYRLLASLSLSVLLSLLETDTTIAVGAIVAFWGISFSKILYPNKDEEGERNGNGKV